MSDYKLHTSKEPIRLFKSDFLEFFSHISPAMVLAIWIPLILFFLSRGIFMAVQVGAGVQVGVFFFGGWFVWTFMEYVIHRFIFHYHPKTERLKRFFFTFHGVHHSQPMCKTRLVMPPVLSVPLGGIFYLLFYLVLVVGLKQPIWLNFAFAGFAIGYTVYDIIHFLLHHAKTKNGYLAMCRRQHMRHHAKCPNMRFGVSIPIWDYVFGTMPKSGLGRRMTVRDKG